MPFFQICSVLFILFGYYSLSIHGGKACTVSPPIVLFYLIKILDARYAGIIQHTCHSTKWILLRKASPDDMVNTAISIRLMIMDMMARAAQVLFVWMVLSQNGSS